MNYNEDVRYWMNEIDDAKKRDKDWCKNGELLNEMYDGEKPDEHPFNILFSNTETLSPALYSQLPRPAVKERFAEKDINGLTVINPLNKAVCEASNAMLSYLMDTNVEGYESFHDSIKANILDALVPGRAVTAIQFDAKMDDDKVEWASVVANTKKYNRFLHGFATQWENVPWIAYEEFMDEDEAEEKFGEKSKDLQYTISDEDEKNNEERTEKRKTAHIYQIWCKDSKTIKWVSPSCKEFLKIDEDPLDITGFFNTPKPLMLHRKSNNLKPTPLYALYENQAKELNRLTRSINKVAMAIKVRGGYNGALSELFERLLDEEDNTLVPIENLSTMMEGGLEKQIWLLPLGELVGVLQILYGAREQCKQVIYEITGISDIIRGQSKASETLGAQKVKEAWGTMRLKNMQSDVQDYVRKLLRIMLDVAVKNLSQSMWIKVTGLNYPTEEKKEKALQLINQIKPELQQLMVEGQDQKRLKKLQKEAEDLTKILSTPSWESILETLKDDYIRSFKIDIETNSTLDAEATEDKKNIAEAMNAMAQFMNGLMPMVKERILPFGAAKSMLLDIVKRYRFGVEVEDEINAMTEPQGPNAEQVQEQQKKLMEEKKKLEQEREKFEQEQKKVGDALDEQVNQLARDKMEFDHQKKLFTELTKLKQTFNDAQNDLKSQEDIAEVKNILEDHKRSVQSMMDKQVSNMKDTIASIQ